MSKSIIAITMGDPGGIGPEVIAKSFQNFKASRGGFFLLIGTPEPFEFLKEKFGISLPLHPIPTLEPSFLREDSINFLDVSEEVKWLISPSSFPHDFRRESATHDPRLRTCGDDTKAETMFEYGEVSKQNAAAAFVALKVAAYQAATGLIQGIVTAPINKTAMRSIDPKFSGHTEYLAKVSKTKSFAMMFVGPRLKVTLCTIHEPLKKVSRLITQELVKEKIVLTHEFLRERLKIQKPHIAVCALNPHGKETGEEDEIAIRPAVDLARQEKINAEGPLSADQLFHDAYEGRFDAVIAMYHDQGLAPFKMVSFRDGVNVTLGLPFVRTSPDHGTAFDIAYQGKADPSSMKTAILLAEQLVTQ